MIGRQIGSYRILEKIGAGGMGVVYQAMDTGLDRLVAIKVLNPDLAHDPELVRRFRAEAKAQANLNHPNIATLHAFVEIDEQCLIVMEFLEGDTFEDILLKSGKVPWQGAISLARQTLQGLEFAHSRGVIHRDIKPGNLMLTGSGTVKIMDFGIAKALGDSRKTRTGLQMGTPHYMPPEQIRSETVDARSDVYSLGITLHQLMTGNLPFEGKSDFELMSAHINTPPPLLRSFETEIPPSVEQCVGKALAKKPEDRFQSAGEFSTALEAAVLPEGPVLSAVDGRKTKAVPKVETEKIEATGVEKKGIAKTRIAMIVGSVVLLVGAALVPWPKQKANTETAPPTPQARPVETDPSDIGDRVHRKDTSPDPASSTAPPTNDQPKSPVKTPHRIADIPGTSSEIRADVILRPDVSCTVFVDNAGPIEFQWKWMGQTRAAEIKQISLGSGQHLVRAKNPVSGFQIERTILVSSTATQYIDLPLGEQEKAAEQVRPKKVAHDDEENGDQNLEEAITGKWRANDEYSGLELDTPRIIDQPCAKARDAWESALQKTTDPVRIERLKKKLYGGKGITCESTIINWDGAGTGSNERPYRPCVSNGGNENIDIAGNGARYHVPLSSCNTPVKKTDVRLD